jgi:hypothetical protein
MNFYKCGICTMFHRSDFFPERDCIDGERQIWVEPAEQWVWGRQSELPPGAVVKGAGR